MCLGPGILPSPCSLPGCAAPPHVFLFLLVPARAAGTTKKKTPTVPARTVIFSYPACEGNAAAIPLCRQIKKQRREGNAAAKSAMPPRNVAMYGLRNSGSHHRVPLRLSGPHTHTQAGDYSPAVGARLLSGVGSAFPDRPRMEEGSIASSKFSVMAY